MQITKISWSFAVYLALIEGIALFLLDLGTHAFFIGFISAAVVLLLYQLTKKILPFKINNKPVSNLPIAILSVFNGLFMMILFLLQDVILRIFNHMFSAIFGFLSVFVTFFLIVVLYNQSPYHSSFNLGKEKLKLRKVSVLFAFYAGLFEFFIMPLILYGYSINLPGFVNGIMSGAIGGLLGLLIFNACSKRYPLVIK